MSHSADTIRRKGRLPDESFCGYNAGEGRGCRMCYSADIIRRKGRLPDVLFCRYNSEKTVIA